MSSTPWQPLKAVHGLSVWSILQPTILQKGRSPYIQIQKHGICFQNLPIQLQAWDGIIPEHLFTVVQVISSDDTYYIINISLKEYTSVHKISGQPHFVPGSKEVSNIRGSWHTHGKAISLPDELPLSINFTAEDEIILLY